MSTLIGVYGASGFGREVMPMVREQPVADGTKDRVFVFIDDSPAAQTVNGHQVVSWDEFLKLPASMRVVSLAISESKAREKLAHRCSEAGVAFTQVRAPNVVCMDDVVVGDGAVLCAFVTLTSNIRIGRHFHANIYSYVAHDCVIGDFVTFAPAAKCNGNVFVEDHAYIGTGAVIKQGKAGDPLVIGRAAVVGMGAVVTKSVPAGTTVVGNPARPLQKS